MKRNTRLMLLVTMSAFMVTGCTGMMMKLYDVRTVKLTHSSLDMNSGEPHNATFSKVSLKNLAKQIAPLAEKRDLILVSTKCADDGCEVVYKRKEESRQKTVGSGYTSSTSNGYGGGGSSSVTTYNMSFSSRIYVDIKKTEQGTTAEFIGVPVIKSQLSCPKVLELRNECAPQDFNVMGEQTPAQSFQGQWGVDISGGLEAEIITGIIAELEMNSDE